MTVVRTKGGAALIVRMKGGTALSSWTHGETAGGLIDPATPSGTQPVGQSSGWALTFSDEFAGSSVSSSKWDPWYPDTIWFNDPNNQGPAGHLSNMQGTTPEPQTYDPSALSAASGSGFLTMRNESSYTGYNFTSGLISSYPSHSQVYGFFEARLRLPMVPGAWPAFWMMPASADHWPPEIDIMEHYHTDTIYHTTYHWPLAGGGRDSSGSYASVADPTAWHTYAVRWESGRLRWYLDGTLTNDLSSAYVTSEAMYLILNLAAYYTTPLVDPANLPFSVEVDYVRAWGAV